MYDLNSTNNVFGWLIYYAAHLYYRCGITDLTELIAVIEGASNRVFRASLTGDTDTLSDNECVMLTNRWFYAYVQDMGFYAGDHHFLHKDEFWAVFKEKMLSLGVKVVAEIPE